jgi:hypothetical protein
MSQRIIKRDANGNIIPRQVDDNGRPIIGNMLYGVDTGPSGNDKYREPGGGTVGMGPIPEPTDIGGGRTDPGRPGGTFIRRDGFDTGPGSVAGGMPLPAGTGGGADTNNTLVPAQTQAYNPNSQLYNWQLGENTRKLRQALAARGNLTSGAGAQIENQMQSGLAAGEVDKQYNRTLDLVKLGLGQGASAGQWAQQGANTLGGLYGGLGQGLGNTYGRSGQNMIDIYGRMGDAGYQTGGNIGTIQGGLPTANYRPPQGRGGMYDGLRF